MVVVAPAPIDFAPSNPPTNAIPTRTCLVKAPFIRLTQIMCLVLNSVVLGDGARPATAFTRSTTSKTSTEGRTKTDYLFAKV
ncbi:hypothetical protein TanjilG_05660 [Lupinus angustifolius]|uniref:Uncharacterized protein n=1 Tax=Lupinus angustifolius TaxID=3871 RepID=A0A4P1QSK6_LUPAN|nr:hypothetical protein TanjilG_05660 [Lupinus angustifolius]